MTDERIYEVAARWDPGASVWTAKGKNFKGLSLHGRTRDELMEKLMRAIPPLVTANEGKFLGGSLHIIWDEMVPMRRQAA